MNTLGERLKFILDDKRLSNEKAGAIAGVTKQSIGAIVNGDTLDPKSSVIYQLCKNLNVNMEWLLFGEGPVYVPSITTESDSIAVQELVKEVNFQRELIQNLNEKLDRKEKQLDVFIDKFVAKLEATSKEPQEEGNCVEYSMVPMVTEGLRVVNE